MGAPSSVPPGGGGALPPYGSDLSPRQVSPAGGGLPPTAPAVPPPAASPAVPPPLPPGVAASNVGAAAAGALTGLKSTQSDPLLESASQMVYQLVHASRLYGTLDWCVAVFKTPHGADTVVLSNEGLGYIPSGVFLPRSTRLLFADNGLPDDFRTRWFGWANPAQVMVAYAALLNAHDPNVELYALAVSTDHGGSALPARDAGVPHYVDCALLTSPIPVGAAAAALDGNHVHRLETLDHAQYVRLTRMSVPEAQQRDDALATTRRAVQLTLSRASSQLGLPVPPVLRNVLAALESGTTVTEAQWGELEMARFNATLDSASQRAGRSGEETVSAFARSHHNLARAAGLLSMWRGSPLYVEIAYEAMQITKEAQLWPGGGA
jgi:hypothetical protein